MSTARNLPAIYDRLGISPEAITDEPTVGPHLELLPNKDPFYYLQCSDSKEARDILSKYYSLPKSLRKRLPFEAFCAAASVGSLRALEIIFGTAARLAAQHTTVATIMAHEAQPALVAKSVELAMEADGFEDRQLLAKVTGLLPAAKGPQVKVNVTQNASATAAAVSAAPPPEQTIRRMVDRFNDNRTISADPPPSLPAYIDADTDEEEE